MRTLPIALLIAALPLSGAQAAVWAWGCQGQFGDEQLIFNRYNMAIFKSGKWKLGDVKRLINDDIKTPPDTTADKYDPQNTNEAFEYSTIEFLGKDDPKRKATLTEKSSKRLSHRHKNIGGRDEDVDTYRKVYAFKRGNEPFRDITMQCIEYQLSTCGGRCK